MTFLFIIQSMLCVWLAFRAFIRIEPPQPEELYYDPRKKLWFFGDDKHNIWSAPHYHRAKAKLGRYLLWKYDGGPHPGAFD